MSATGGPLEGYAPSGGFVPETPQIQYIRERRRDGSKIWQIKLYDYPLLEMRPRDVRSYQCFQLLCRVKLSVWFAPLHGRTWSERIKEGLANGQHFEDDEVEEDRG